MKETKEKPAAVPGQVQPIVGETPIPCPRCGNEYCRTRGGRGWGLHPPFCPTCRVRITNDEVHSYNQKANDKMRGGERKNEKECVLSAGIKPGKLKKKGRKTMKGYKITEI